jgi:hypothetical protein
MGKSLWSTLASTLIDKTLTPFIPRDASHIQSFTESTTKVSQDLESLLIHAGIISAEESHVSAFCKSIQVHFVVRLSLDFIERIRHNIVEGWLTAEKLAVGGEKESHVYSKGNVSFYCLLSLKSIRIRIENRYGINDKFI